MYKLISCLLIFFSLSTSAGELESSEYSIVTKSETLKISSDKWRKKEGYYPYTKSFQQKENSESHRYNRIVTVFLLPISDDRKVGMKISENEYLEFMIVSEGYVTAQTRVDRGDYWLLCRETFLPKRTKVVDLDAYAPFLSDDKNKALWSLYQNEIDQTRYILHSQF